MLTKYFLTRISSFHLIIARDRVKQKLKSYEKWSFLCLLFELFATTGE